MGLEELIGVLREEAANEERRLRGEAAREAARLVAEARGAAAGLRDAALAREAEAREARLRAARAACELARDRALLLESWRQIEALRAEAAAELPRAVGEADVERLLAALLAEAGAVGGVAVVDPGLASLAHRVVADAGAAQRVEVREAPVARGGVELRTGELVLDDTMGSRLERAWGRAEPEIARILFSSGG